jgi:ABC-type uncharacterized transport system substrate-binding protein
MLLAIFLHRADLRQQAIVYVAKILQGAQPTDVLVEQPPTFKLVVNLKTVQTLGITMLPLCLFLADEVSR